MLASPSLLRRVVGRVITLCVLWSTFFLLCVGLRWTSFGYWNTIANRRTHVILSQNRSPEQPPGRRVAIQTIVIGQANRSAQQNHESYARLWGYDYVAVHHKLDPARGPHWQKIPATLQLFDEDYDYVFWMDADAFFMDCDTSLDGLLDALLDADKSWLFSGDTLVINSGQMLWRNTEPAKDILRGVDTLWYSRFEAELPLRDNAAFAAYLTGARTPDAAAIIDAYDRADRCYRLHEAWFCRQVRAGSEAVLQKVGVEDDLLRHIVFVPHRAINSYLMDVRNGDFVFHCAGEKNKEECLEQFLRKTGRTRGSLVCVGE